MEAYGHSDIMEQDSLESGSFETKDLPTKVDSISTFEDIKAGDDFLMALKSDGTVLVTGTNKNPKKLTQIDGLNNIKKISCQRKYSIYDRRYWTCI